MNAVDRLIGQIKQKNNPTVMGLDPRIEMVPEHIKKDAFGKYGTNLKGMSQAVLEFNKKLIDATYDIVPAVKPQIAFYEILGVEGINAFKETCEYAKSKGMIVIADIKRGDIGSTAEAYSSAYLGRIDVNGELQKVIDVDFVTANPYLGSDSVQPFLEDCKKYDKGMFLLVKTSNKSSGDIQDVRIDSGKFLYEHVASLVEKWGEELTGEYGYSSIGVVVGATYPEQMVTLRKILKKSYILVPGYGAQGGSAQDAAKAFNADGLGAIVNASRSIMAAYKSEKWKAEYSAERFDEAARAEAIRMRDDLNGAINTKQ